MQSYATMTLIDRLQSLGFTELEARCLSCLAASGKMTGYEVAKTLGASRSNVYAALSSLADSGAVRTIKGEPTYYQPLPPAELTGIIDRRTQESLAYIREHMSAPVQDDHDFFSVEGEKTVRELVQHHLSAARSSVLGDLWSEEVSWLESDLRTLDHRKKFLFRIVVIGKTDVKLKGYVAHPRDDSWQRTGFRKFSFIIDGALAILGVRGAGGTVTRALISRHPALIQLLQISLFQDLVLHELTLAYGPELESRYGKNFELILKKYTGMNFEQMGY